MMDDWVEPDRDTAEGLKAALHQALGVENACGNACTHVVYGAWTVHGIANVCARAAARERTSRSQPHPDPDPVCTPGEVVRGRPDDA